MQGQKSLENKIDFVLKNETLEDALFQLSQETGLSFSFSSNNLSGELYTIRFRQKKISAILDQLLVPQELSYSIEKDKVLIFREYPLVSYSGYVEDLETGEKLIGAYIYRTNRLSGINSNQYGFFSIEIPSNEIELEVSYLGYESMIINIAQFKKGDKRVQLRPKLTFEEIIIKDFQADLQNLSYRDKLESEILETSASIPSLGGEPDVMRYLMQLPSVKSGADGFGGIIVRGGNADQNLILMDGVEIYNPYHMLGIYSIFDHGVIKKTQFYSGRFPARFGGRLSSVVDVRTKDGHKNKYKISANIGLLASKIAFQGPIVKDKGSFYISARRTHLDPIYDLLRDTTIIKQKTLLTNNVSSLNYHFGEIIAKANYALNKRDQIYFSYYLGEDRFSNGRSINETNLNEVFIAEGSQSLDWGNRLAVFRWNHVFSDKVFSNFTVNNSQFGFLSKERETYFQSDGIDSLTSIFANEFSSKILNTSAKIDIEYVPNNKHYIRSGIAYSYKQFEPGILNLRDSFSFNSNSLNIGDTLKTSVESLQEISFYVEDTWKMNKKLLLNYGVYGSNISVKNKLYTLLDPRIYLTYELNRKHKFGLSFNGMHQNLHLLSRAGAGFPNDLWVPSTDKIRPERAWMGEITYHLNLSKKWQLSTAYYYKIMQNLLFFSENPDQNISGNGISATDWESRVAVGSGQSNGLEMSIAYDGIKQSFWSHFTFSNTSRQFPTVNNGKPFPFRFNNRLKINIGYLWNISKRWTVSSTWNFSDGSNISLPQSFWDYTDQQNNYYNYFIDYTDINGFQLPNYHRLDIGAKYTRKTKHANWSIDFGFYNTYNRKNPYYVVPRFDAEKQVIKYKQVVLIPILPYFNLNIEI